MENTPAFHPLDYVSVLKRRKWWLIVPSVLAVSIGVALALWLPRTYLASTTLGVALPVVSQELVSSAARVSPQERLRTIQQILYSPAVLERVVREEGLDQQMPMADATRIVRSQVVPTIPRPDPALPPGAGALEQFSIGYTSERPEFAQRMANRVAEVFVAETLRRREVRAEETSTLVNTQLQSSQARLDELEERLRVAKEAYMGALPEQANANLSMATSLQQQLETTRNAIRGEQDRLSIIERQMETMKAVASAESVPGAPPVASSAAARAAQIERELASMRGRYTDQHPEVTRLRGELAAAKAAAEAEASLPEEQRTASLSLDRGYSGLMADQERARLRIRELQRQETQIGSRIEMYRARVESAPRVEQQMAALQREYDLEREQYSQLANRLRTAQMDETLVRHSGGEQFTILSAAPLPRTPESPNVERLLLVTIVLGLCLGGGLALGREYLDRSIHDTRAMTDLEVPVLGEIPRIAQT